MTDLGEFRRNALERHLKPAIQGEVHFDLASRRLYSTDASVYQIEPLGVVLPKTVEDLRVAIQISAEHHVPIVPRGGGTSLSGQSIGPGVVIDCSKYLHEILEIDPRTRSARVQPGVVLDQLNRALEWYDLQFGPDVATASRACLGGMIGNNSAGARSIVYGKTIDHVQKLRVVLADGTATVCEPLTVKEWERKAIDKSREAAIYRAARHLVESRAAEIRRRFPRILRRVSGYNFDALLDQFEGPAANLSSLLVGSEGTLAFVTEAELGLVPRPKVRGLLVPHFSSLTAALDALHACLEFQPSAVELMDQLMLDLARANLALKRRMQAIQGRPAALFMVEFSSDDPLEVEDRLDKLDRRLREAPGVIATVKATEPALRESLWNLRSAGVPLLLGMPGDRKPVTFVEDAAVAPEKLPEFAARFRDLLRRHGTDGAFYGHASVGCLHIRPVLNLKDPEDVARMRRITEEVTDLVLEFGGALSGEHGDGLARSEWNRKMFGDELYQAFRELKHAFDPDNLFNPGKVVDAPAMTENLRYGETYRTTEPLTVFDYSKQEGFARSIEMCNGSGVCRRMHGGTMCPSFRATRDEKDSTRGRANALRLALSGEKPLEELRADWVYQVLDLCLMCKACKAECPSNVDLTKLKAEFLHYYYESRSRPLGHRAMAHIYRLNQWGSRLAPLANLVGRSRLVRWLMEKFGGVDRRRSLPRFRWNHFRRWFRRHRHASSLLANKEAGGVESSSRRVLLLDDCFTTYNEPQIGRAAVRVLEHAGYDVELTGLTCCGRPMISKGMLNEARALVVAQAEGLAQRVANGTPILGLEPSCLLTLSDEWPELAPGEETRRVAAAAHLTEDWLAEQVRTGACQLPLTPRPGRAIVHGHCHQKALVGLDGTAAALRLIPELEVKVLDTGCCGMAGSFGYEKEHYDLSVAIANLSVLPELEKEPEALVVAPGTSCRHQIKDLAGRRARHPMEVLAEQLS